MSIKISHFSITGEGEIIALDTYVSLIHPNHRKPDTQFLQNFNKKANKYCQNTGLNYLQLIPKMIATSRKLDSPDSYTGHCFRRTGANLLVDAQVPRNALKAAGRWQSEKAMDGYIETSTTTKVMIADSLAAALPAKLIKVARETPMVTLNKDPEPYNASRNSSKGSGTFSVEKSPTAYPQYGSSRGNRNIHADD